MEVSCPNCYATYPINPEKLPEKGATPTCKKCGAAFTIVRATGDPVRDRAHRMKGYVLIREGQREELHRERVSSSEKISRKNLSVKAVLESRSFRRGAWIAGIALLVCCAAFLVWKNHVHGRFEKALKSSLIYASNERFAVNFESVSFSWLGGLIRDQGLIHGLSVTDHKTRQTHKLAEKIHFDLEASRKRFITRPFNIQVDGKGAKTVLKGCVLETREGDESHLTFKADEAYLIVNSIEWFTVQAMEISFLFNATGRQENRRFISGDGDFCIRAGEIQVWSEPIIKNTDILLSIKNGVLATAQTALAPTSGNVMDLLRTQWGENQAVAALERCSFTVFGSTVKAAGTLEFQNPMERSKASMIVSVNKLSPIMKYIHRVSEITFDRILVTLVALDEKNASAYNKAADSLELSLSYRDSGIRVNEQEIQSLL
jgi:predicted Zn finger-like uncharacterized protein